MGESTHQPQHQATTSSRLGMRTAAASGIGEIVEVQGGHIVRSTGRKDRHSKVCTAKGPRDRRVRLSAHTAIQFYDVQDRLGYDRPSKAVDWLIKKAKAAIDELAELPAWNPNTTTSAAPNAEPHHQLNNIPMEDAVIGSGSRRGAAAATVISGRMSESFQTQPQQLVPENDNSNKFKFNTAASSGFLPPSLDNDIADTIKSFFPMVAAADTPTTSFQNYPPPPDLLSRTASGAATTHNHQQDLRLSLQSFQDPILLHQHHHQPHEQVLFGTAALGFDGGGSSGWSDQHGHGEEHEHGRLHRMVAWNAAADAATSGHGGGFVFNAPSPPSTVAPTAVFGHGQYFSQRGPLQSSNTPSIRAWMDPASVAAAASVADHHHHHHHHYLSPAMIHQASVSGGGGIGFAASSGGFSGFRIPARIQGEEEHDGVSDKPSSASSDSRH